jgi:hypothetical protein
VKVELVEDKLPDIGSSALERSPGLHLSSIIKDLNKTLGRSKEGSGWDMGPTCAVGLLWEEILSTHFAEALGDRIGEVELDGVAMTPDGFIVDEWVLAEHKATWRSSTKHSVGDIWDWMTQIKAYCYALNTHRCLLRVLWVVGDYRGSGPQYQCFLLTFTDNELMDNWQMLMNHKRVMEGRDGDADNGR